MVFRYNSSQCFVYFMFGTLPIENGKMANGDRVQINSHEYNHHSPSLNISFSFRTNFVFFFFAEVFLFHLAYSNDISSHVISISSLLSLAVWYTWYLIWLKSAVTFVSIRFLFVKPFHFKDNFFLLPFFFGRFGISYMGILFSITSSSCVICIR